jgi:hypothetical protein
VAIGFYGQLERWGESDAAQQVAGADQVGESASEVCIAFGVCWFVLGLIAQLLDGSAQNRNAVYLTGGRAP